MENTNKETTYFLIRLRNKGQTGYRWFPFPLPSGKTWYHSLALSRGLVNWVDLKEKLISRFEDEFLDDIVEHFNYLVQKGSMDEFLRKFEDLKAQMLVRNPHINDAHFLSSFIGALKEEIRFAVNMFKPTTLKLAIEKARMQEKVIEVVQRRNNVTTKPATAMSHNSISKALGNSAWHQCRPKQLNCLTGGVEIDEGVYVEVEDQTYMYLRIEGEIEHEVQEAVCLNALTGSIQGVNTILVSGTMKNRILTMLIDSRSTHSFIDQHTVIGAGYKASYCEPVRVTVAGNYFMCTSHCQGFKLKMQGGSFQEDLLLIPLGGCDLVLRNDWMKKYNATKFDH
ncbi:hypothetical protein KY284_001364 [Solanum tuberosum]|nr:hypothetical protein KY284_001364 [Solanum tuberosum]